MKKSVEYVQGRCYKIRMFGVQFEDPNFVYGYNQFSFNAEE